MSPTSVSTFGREADRVKGKSGGRRPFENHAVSYSLGRLESKFVIVPTLSLSRVPTQTLNVCSNIEALRYLRM